MDLVREILLVAENASGIIELSKIVSENHSQEEIAYHFQLLIDAGFAQGQALKNGAGLPVDGVIQNLTWKGQEFLDLCRKDTIWEKAKKNALDVTGSLGFEVLKTCLIKVCKDLI
jgi:hypothetical protein